MTTYIPAGLGETFGFVKEATVGTFVTPTKWVPHKKADFHYKKTTAQSEALRGSRFLAASRRVLIAHSVDGSVELELADRQLGQVLNAMLGAASPSGTSNGSLYNYVLLPGFLEGVSLSIQKGVPTISGGIQAFSYNGVKVKDWTITCARGGIASLALTLDAWNEATATAYTAPSYLTGASVPALLNWGSGSLLTGGTVSTTANVTTVASGAAPVGLVSSISIKGTNVLSDDRFTLGSQTKAEQVTNGFTTITGEVEIEFANLPDFYSAFAADTSTALQINLTGATTGGTSPTNSGLYIILPNVKFEGDTPDASGPGIIKVKVPFTALDDQTGTGTTADPVIQMTYVSADSTL